MAEPSSRTMVCSVLFLDIVGYSRKTVAEQIELKHACNNLLADALGNSTEADGIILDTGDGAAVTFLGAPENALFVALRTRDGAGALPIRLGVNLGPVRLVTDLNGQVNVVGDGINVAQRVMSFCEPGQLLVSRSFYEVACRLSKDYVNLFSPEGSQVDKHSRTHELYATAPDARARLRIAEAEWLQRTLPPKRPRNSGVAPSIRGAGPARKPAAGLPDEPPKVFDAGENLVISGHDKAGVEEALGRYVGGGARVISPISQVGDKWVAVCEHLHAVGRACKVEALGFTRIVTGPTREDVSAKVSELLESGAVLLRDIECVNGVWTAVCEATRR